jgi:hypothetical protein
VTVFYAPARLGGVPPSTRRILWFFLIGLSAAVFWYFIPRTEATITRQLEEISEEFSFTDEQRPIDQIQRLIEKHFASTMTLELGDQGETTYVRSEVVKGYVRYCSRISQLKLDLAHLEVKLSRDRERVTVKGALLVNLRLSKNEQRTEPRRFVLTLEQHDEHWFIVHAKVTEPRIDQPEARP